MRADEIRNDLQLGFADALLRGVELLLEAVEVPERRLAHLLSTQYPGGINNARNPLWARPVARRDLAQDDTPLTVTESIPRSDRCEYQEF